MNYLAIPLRQERDVYSQLVYRHFAPLQRINIQSNFGPVSPRQVVTCSGAVQHHQREDAKGQDVLIINGSVINDVSI